MAHALQAQPAVVTYFPAVREFQGSETYRAVVDAAKAEYQKNFQLHSAKCDEIDALAAQWNERNVELIAGTADQMPSKETLRNEELIQKREKYMSYRATRKDLDRILKVYDRAILYCTPPVLDVATIEVLVKLKAKVSDLKFAFDQIFTTERDSLIEQRAKIQELYEKIILKEAILCTALENLAYFAFEYNPVSYQPLKLYEGSTHPLVKQLVTAREKELVVITSAADDDNKSNK